MIGLANALPQRGHLLERALGLFPKGALFLMLFASLLALPQQWGFLQASLPVIRLWSDPEAQRSLQLGDVPYTLLEQVDTILPADASVLLVTSGDDVRHLEYTTYHRALYFLAPRSVWWVSPAPTDGTWESRWWISVPLYMTAIQALAAEKGVTHILTYNLPQPLSLGQPILSLDGGTLFPLDNAAPAPSLPAPRVSFASNIQLVRLFPALAVLFAVGATSLLLIRRDTALAHPIEQLYLAWLFGLGIVSIGMVWLNALHFTLNAQTAILSVLAVAGILWYQISHVKQRPAPNTAQQTSSRFTITQAVLLMWLFLQLGFVIVMALGQPLFVWDSWATWGMKARTIFLEGGISPAIYADASRAVTHLDYPLLLPLAQAWFYSWLGVPDDRFAALPIVLSHCALLGICYHSVRRWGGTQTQVLLATTVVASIPNFSLLMGQAFADIPLALLCTAATVYFCFWLDEGRAGDLAIAAFAAGLMPWAKREGIVLLVVLSIAALLVAGGSRRARYGVGAFLLSALFLAGPWYWFIWHQSIAGTDFLPVTWTTLQANANRLPTIIRLTLLSLLSLRWSFVWPLTALAVGVHTLRSNVPLLSQGSTFSRTLAIMPLAAILYLFLMAATYLFSAFVPYEQHILSSYYRLAAHVLPLPILWFAFQVIQRGELT